MDGMIDDALLFSGTTRGVVRGQEGRSACLDRLGGRLAERQDQHLHYTAVKRMRMSPVCCGAREGAEARPN